MNDAYPEAGLGDAALDVFKGIASALPGGGALAALIKTEHSRRVEAFHRRTSKRVNALEKRSASTLLQRAVNGDQAAKDELLSTYATIHRLVLETLEQEKMEALASALAHSIMWSEEDGAAMERRHFLRCVADFDAVHIDLLSRARAGVQAVKPLVKASGASGETAQTAWKELHDRGMVSIDDSGMNFMMTAHGMSEDRTTSKGARFLSFVGQA